ncbi:hypothetical protein KC19_5G171000 [Ceratodon purpureus]|uniref:Uncharacterized protein n=1 Tax=Ceratodon purpureus TaxID=3225 RepID=A0A8T0I2I6_CERPU|nr:hypothetical protein KC19_5G171000 [Ceratodon purpureus]
MPTAPSATQRSKYPHTLGRTQSPPQVQTQSSTPLLSPLPSQSPHHRETRRQTLAADATPRGSPSTQRYPPPLLLLSLLPAFQAPASFPSAPRHQPLGKTRSQVSSIKPYTRKNPRKKVPKKPENTRKNPKKFREGDEKLTVPAAYWGREQGRLEGEKNCGIEREEHETWKAKWLRRRSARVSSTFGRWATQG